MQIKKPSEKEVSDLQQLLEQELSDESVTLYGQLAKLSGLIGRVNRLRADAEYHVANAKRLALDKIWATESSNGQKISALERETILDNLVAQNQHLLDVLSGISEAMASKMILGQSLLKSVDRDRGFGQT